jgi:hypothetical protein
MRPLPFRSALVVVAQAISGAAGIPGTIKTVSNLALGAETIVERRAAAIVVMSKEVAELASGPGAALFGTELRNAVAVATDQEFLAIVTAGASPITSAGGTSIGILQDIDAALAALDIDAASQLYIIIPTTSAKAWCCKTTGTGEIAFPQMTPRGGNICGMQVLVSDGVENGTMIVVDATQLGAASSTVGLSEARHASVQLDTAPDSPTSAATVLVSLWQRNLVGVRAERVFGCVRLRDAAVALVTGQSYSGNSPN